MGEYMVQPNQQQQQPKEAEEGTHQSSEEEVQVSLSLHFHFVNFNYYYYGDSWTHSGKVIHIHRILYSALLKNYTILHYGVLWCTLWPERAKTAAHYLIAHTGQ